MEDKLKSLLEITKELLELDVSKYVEEKNKLKYLSWANAIKEALKVDPEFEYSIIKNEDGIPIFGNSQLGYMVYTTATFQGKTRECWLPVMNGANKPMKDERYTITNRYGKESVVEALNMFDINKTVMRCLTKNLAMFGLGLYIYAGEDLPEDSLEPQDNIKTETSQKKKEQPKKQEGNKEVKTLSEKQLSCINSLITKTKSNRDKIKQLYQVFSLSELSSGDASKLIKQLKEKEEKNK